MPKPGDIITIQATVLSVDEAAKIVVLDRVRPPKQQGSTSNGDPGDGGFAVMWNLSSATAGA